MRQTFIRRFGIGLAVAGLVLLGEFGNLIAAEIEPFEARVIVARAQIRSGPGDNFYPTDALPAGETVEVYREAAGGWLAIRPPRESYSWVFGRHLKLGENGLAEIEKTEVDSRIGSRYSSQRNAVQVRLRKGEVVEILGEEPAGNETWYKIAPPAGEFRWIHATQVQHVGPIAARIAEADDDSNVVNTSATATDTESPLEAPPLGSAAPESAPAAQPPEQTAPGGSAWRSASAATEAAIMNAAPPQSTAPQTAQGASATPNATASGTPSLAGDLQRQLTDIELRLSRMVAAPANQWNTDLLERDTENLLAAAQTPADREAIKATLAKLDRFAELARRAQQSTGPIPATGTMPAQLPPQVTAIVPPADGRQPTVDSSPYDAVGILRPVVSKRPGAPQFALVDDRGQVVSFVTPTPDTNLQPYVGRRIAVNGTRGFINEFQRAHVTAGRVTPLNDRIMR